MSRRAEALKQAEKELALAQVTLRATARDFAEACEGKSGEEDAWDLLADAARNYANAFALLQQVRGR